MKIYTFSKYLKEHFFFPVRKLPIHTFLGCPHRKNKIGAGGCFYCNNTSFSNCFSVKAVPVKRQISEGIVKAKKRGYKGKFIVYYQSYTNTFGELPSLESLFSPVYEFKEDIVGLSVSTRPDCLGDDVLDLLNSLGEDFMLWLEIGLQSANDKTLFLINRGHDYLCFVEAIKRSRRYKNLLLCAHIILGLPGETREDMAFTIKKIRELALDGIKIHHLQIIRDTVFARWFKEGKIDVMNWEEYMNLLLYLLPLLGSNIVIHRLVSDAPESMLIAPRWEISKQKFLQKLYERLSLV